MNEESLPPSFNWFLSSVLACTEDGTIAYGSRNEIVIAKYLSGTSTLTPQISIISHAHKDRITVVAFSTSKSNSESYWNCLVSAADDSVIKVWSLDTQTAILAHNTHEEGTKVLAMDWSKCDPNLIVSADELGNVVSWDLLSNTTQKMNFGKLVPTCLACCPHKQDLAALGTRSGLVCVISLKGNGKMLHRMRGHDTEVVSLAWCPVSYNVLQSKEHQNDMLLASGAKEKSIYIWRAGGDGRYETVINLPTALLVQGGPSAQQQHRSRLGASAAGAAGGNGSWTCISWSEPNTILSSSLWGELLACNLQNLKSNKQLTGSKLWQLVHACHARGVFCISCTPSCETEDSTVVSKENGLSSETDISDNELHNSEHVAEKDAVILNGETKKQQQIVWTLAQDRKLVACYWKTREIVSNITTLGGFVYCIATSPLDSNRIAFGVGDGTIRVWNLSNSTTLDITSLWQKINGKVMALAWHPTREGWLAYGTSEGRVGIYDVSSGKLPILFQPYLRRNVYSMSWGPALCTLGDTVASGHVLYCCGDGEIVLYNPVKPKEEPIKLKALFQVLTEASNKPIKRTELAWKPDYTMLAVGNENGTVQIVSAPHLKLINTLISHKKLIQCAAWHPESTATDTGYSPYRHWLAVAASENDIKVFDFSQLVEGGMELEEEQMKPIQNSITLKGHLKKVVNMCWSPHIGGQLVSVSYDFTAQVWNVPSQEPIANFHSHSGSVYCCVWSPLDPDLVITGSSDYTLRVWRVSSQTRALPVEKKKTEKMQRKKPVKVVPASKSENGVILPTGVDGECTKPRVPDEQPANTIEFPKGGKDAEVPAPAACKNKKKFKTFFPVSSHHHQQEQSRDMSNCYRLLEAYCSSAKDNDGKQTYELPSYLGFFGDRNAMHRLLDEEVEHHISNGNVEGAEYIGIWKGNVTEVLKEAARQKQLSDWLVSLAPMASQRLWMEMCRAYSEQLETQGFYQKAASYLLVCHKVTEAIELLVNHHQFREALAIAHCRLGPDDPTLKKIIRDWAKTASKEGNYEVAVECLITVGELLEAAMLIRKRNDGGSLKLAALLAHKAGAQDLASMFASQSARETLLSLNWNLAREVVSQHPYLKHLSLMVTVHHTVAELSEANDQSLYLKWLHKCEHLPSRLPSLFELIASRCNVDISEDSTQEVYDMLLKEYEKNDPPNTKEKLWFAVSVELALSYVSIGMKRFHHLVTAMSIFYQYRQLHPTSQHFLLQLCVWLTPLGPFAENSIFFTESNEELRASVRSVRSYLCAGVLDWVTEYLESAESDGEKERDCELLSDGTDSDGSKIVSGENRECRDCQNMIVGQWHDLLHLLRVCKDDILAKESVQYFQDCIKIKKLEHEAATAVAKSRKSSPESTDAARDSSVDSLQQRDSPSLTNTDGILSKLQQLKLQKETFETKYISMPNPFVTYCKIKNLLTHLRKTEPESCDDISEQYEFSWKNISLNM